VVATFGFMDQPDVPKALALARERGLTGGGADVTYYLAHLSLFSDGVSKLGMMEWREKLFIFLSRNARRATSFFEIPADRVVEIGMQLEI
jgi:KUP system potassium uptake protein